MSTCWYVLRSKPHKELALNNLAQSEGHATYYPTIPSKTKSSAESAYFPGYLFVRVDLEATAESQFRWMPFSQGLVHVGGEPASVFDWMMRAIRTRVNQIWNSGGLVFNGIKKGDPVVVRDGPFEGYVGIFDCTLPGSDRVRILLKMLSDRYVPAELDGILIEKGSQGVSELQP